MTRSTTTSRGWREPRVRGRRVSHVRERCGGERLGDGVRCGVFPFADRGGVLLPPDVPILFDGGDRPRSGGDDIAAR